MKPAFKDVQERVRTLPWASVAAFVLASAERLLSYRDAYLRLEAARKELDMTREPDLQAILDRAWVVAEGDSSELAIPFGFDGELGSLWGDLAGMQIKCHLFDACDAVVARESSGHLQLLIRSGFEIFCSLQEFADDGFLSSLEEWRGPEGEELAAMSEDLGWLEEQGEPLVELRDRWRTRRRTLVLKEGLEAPSRPT